MFLLGEEKTCLRFATTSEKVLEGIGGEPQTDTNCLGEDGKERGEGREGVFTAAFAFDIFCGEPGGDRAGLPVEPRPAGRRGGAQACISLVRVRSVEGGTEHEGGAEVLEDEGLVVGRGTRGGYEGVPERGCWVASPAGPERVEGAAGTASEVGVRLTAELDARDGDAGRLPAALSRVKTGAFEEDGLGSSSDRGFLHEREICPNSPQLKHRTDSVDKNTR